MLFRRQAWNSTGPFLCNDQQTDDWEYFVRASRRYQFMKLAEPLVLYRQHPGSLSRKVPVKNTTELMRDALIAQYGTNSPDGTPVNGPELERRRYVGWRNFADAHCARGSLGTGLGVFGKLLISGPQRGESVQRLAKSLLRRAFPRT